jgi:hypothetical protein
LCFDPHHFFFHFFGVLMEPVALINHGINLLAPAFWLAFLLPILSRIFLKKTRVALVFTVQVAINFIVCAFVMAFGLVVFGHDGKMMTYLLMVALSASTQWVLVKGWRG